jgi:hypothetical protein
MNAVGTVEQLLAQVEAARPDVQSPALTLWVPGALTFNGEPIPQAFAMAIVGDHLLAKGYFPAGFDIEGAGRRYNYRFEAA